MFIWVVVQAFKKYAEEASCNQRLQNDPADTDKRLFILKLEISLHKKQKEISKLPEFFPFWPLPAAARGYFESRTQFIPLYLQPTRLLQAKFGE